MTRLLRRAAATVQNAMTLDRETELFLAKTHVSVSLNSRLWGI